MTTETARVYFLPRFLRRAEKAPDGDIVLRTQYDVYHLLKPLSDEQRAFVLSGVSKLMSLEGKYQFED